MRRWIDGIRQLWEESSWAERLYMGGALWLLLSLFWILLWERLSNQYLPTYIVMIVVLVPFTCFGVGFSLEVFYIIRRLWKKGGGKFMTTLMGGIAAGILWSAKIFAAHLINGFIPVQPSHFVFSMQFFTVSLALLVWTAVLAFMVFMTYVLVTVYLLFEISKPYLLLLLGAIFVFMLMFALILLLYVSLVVILVLYLLYKYNKISGTAVNKVNQFLFSLFSWIGKPFADFQESLEKNMFSWKRFISAFARVLGAVLVLSIIMNIITTSTNNTENLSVVSTTIIALVDHYSNSTCVNYNSDRGERVAYIGEGKISVAVPQPEGGYKFEIRDCVP